MILPLTALVCFGAAVLYSAAGGSLQFTPDISLAALRALKEKYGEKTYGRYGFADAFNPNTGWVDPDVIGIDQGITLIGGVIAAYIGGGIISLGSLVGFFTVLGIVARNGIMLISHYQHLERFEGVAFGPELIIRGARERVVPILMTVLTTGLVLVPLILAGQIPGNEIEHPMAIVILGGLITATLLNLFVVPALYLRFGKPSEPTPSGIVATA